MKPKRNRIEFRIRQRCTVGQFVMTKVQPDSPVRPGLVLASIAGNFAREPIVQQMVATGQHIFAPAVDLRSAALAARRARGRGGRAGSSGSLHEVFVHSGG